jgi:hypothetical protein
MKVKQGSTYVDTDGSYNGFSYEVIGARIKSVSDSASSLVILPGVLVSIGQNDYYHYNRTGTTFTLTRSDNYYKAMAPMCNGIDFGSLPFSTDIYSYSFNS